MDVITRDGLPVYAQVTRDVVDMALHGIQPTHDAAAK
jgi:hypothetical protein